MTTIVSADNPLIQRSSIDPLQDWYRPQGLVHAMPEMDSALTMTPEQSFEAFTYIAPICGAAIDGVRGRLRNLAIPDLLSSDDYIHAAAVDCPECIALLEQAEVFESPDGNHRVLIIS